MVHQWYLAFRLCNHAGYAESNQLHHAQGILARLHGIFFMFKNIKNDLVDASEMFVKKLRTGTSLAGTSGRQPEGCPQSPHSCTRTLKNFRSKKTGLKSLEERPAEKTNLAGSLD